MRIAVLLVFWIGCGDNVLVLEGERFQYVVSELRVPSTNTQAREYGLDVDGDNRVDNQLGMVFSTLDGLGLGVGDTATEALLRGGMIMLGELQTTSFDDTKISRFTTFLGSDPVPDPCLDPNDLQTCGQHLKGTGEFSVDVDAISDLSIGPIVDGVFRGRLGLLPVQLAIDAGVPIRLDLRGAGVRLTQISEGHVSGVFAGGITQSDIRNVMIPQAATQIDRIVRTECAQPDGQPPCGCKADTRGKMLQGFCDTDNSCAVSVDELANNPRVQSLVEPDLEIDGEQLLSFGVAVELTAATFESPVP